MTSAKPPRTVDEPDPAAIDRFVLGEPPPSPATPAGRKAGFRGTLANGADRVSLNLEVPRDIREALRDSARRDRRGITQVDQILPWLEALAELDDGEYLELLSVCRRKGLTLAQLLVGHARAVLKDPDLAKR